MIYNMHSVLYLVGYLYIVEYCTIEHFKIVFVTRGMFSIATKFLRSLSTLCFPTVELCVST
jgi:hypothetical protein